VSFMDDIKKEMEATRGEAEEKLDKARAEKGADENGVVVSDDGTAREQSWDESSFTERNS
jgi:hypothetical protein